LGLAPPTGYIIYRLTKHRMEAQRQEERTRTQLIFFGLMVALALGSTELLNNFFPFLDGFGHAGTLAVSATLTIVILRFRLLDYEAATGNWLIGTTVALIIVSGYLLFFGTSRPAFLVFIAAALAFVLVVALREIVLATARRRERFDQYATLGRFSAQMAHDIKNPLTAIKGAVQYLEAEAESGALGDAAEVVSLIEEHVVRLETIVDRYQRMSSVTPKKKVAFDLKEMLESIVRGARLSRSDIAYELTVDERLSNWVGDRELLERVFENLVRNAGEAIESDEGIVEVQALKAWNGADLLVRDNGKGMDQRSLELAFDDFYTTKADGTGLGLAFARRVVEAHGGRIELSSTLDSGTEVTIHLPTA
jgi:signal transduction histidine kinase